MKEKLIFLIPLLIFLAIGIAGLYFGLKFPKNVPIYGWVIIGLFVLFPSVLIYGLVFGFDVSGKQQKAVEERQNSMTFSEKGICVSMPLFDVDCHIKWSTIDSIIYEDHTHVQSFQLYKAYRFYLNEIPHYSKHKKQWWLNKLFPSHAKKKEIMIKDNCENFYELPEMIQKYLDVKVELDLEKGELVSSETTYKNNQRETVEYYKAKKGYESRQILFDRYNAKINTNK